MRLNLNKNLFPASFWIILLIKIVAGSLFASHYVTRGFLPFIKFLLETGNNPYNYFLDHANVVFPYPSGMLLAISPFLALLNFIANVFANINVSLFLFHIPILLADILIYVFLCKLLPSKESKVRLLYFASPILFYINYFHGQLDVIPTAFLVAVLYLISLKKYWGAYLILGLGIATKTHLLIVLPFLAIYFFKQKIKVPQIILMTLASLFIFVLLNLIFISPQYLTTVFNNTEQQRLFLTNFPYFYKGLTLLIAPAALLICFFTFTSFRRVNFDSLVLSLGLVFTILIALVPPMQGWFYWSIPLFIFFLIKYKDSPLISFWAMNIFYILFFVFTSDSDIFESAAVSIPALASIPNPYHLAQITLGVKNAQVIQNLLFTALQVSVATNAFWSYRSGIFYNNLYIDKQKAFTLGIGGDSGVGKSTLARSVTKLVGDASTALLNGDDSHKWERGDKNWKYFTHLNPKANRLHKDLDQIYALIDGKTIERATYNHSTGTFSQPVKIEKNEFIIFQGLHPFYLESMRQVFDLKIFVEAKESLRKRWKIERDTKQRGYSKNVARSVILKRKSDSRKFITPQKKVADWIVNYYDLDGVVGAKHIFKNSVSIETLLDELSRVSGIKLKHIYENNQRQSVDIIGKISRRTIERIAYKLYPNLSELTNHNSEFLSNSLGINQLFFLNYLNYLFINRQWKNS